MYIIRSKCHLILSINPTMEITDALFMQIEILIVFADTEF